MSRDLPAITELLPGRPLRIALERGDVLRVLEGRVRLTAPPRWLGETLIGLAGALQEGEVHVAEQGGWVEIVALTPARLGATARAPSCLRRALAAAARYLSALRMPVTAPHMRALALSRQARSPTGAGLRPTLPSARRE
jgi:hypothetical protein